VGAGDPAASREAAVPAEPVRRLRRPERREQILAAATRAFARAGFAATSLDDVAAEAGITRVILYRHFESKDDMYRAVLDRARIRLAEAVGTDDFTEDAIPALVRAAEPSMLAPLLRGGHCYERSGAGRRHGTGVGRNSTMASATATGLSTGTHVLAPGTETSVAQGKSDASRRASVIGK
jgi:AcrR family transcriptional regulator